MFLQEHSNSLNCLVEKLVRQDVVQVMDPDFEKKKCINILMMIIIMIINKNKYNISYHYTGLCGA